MDKLDRMIEEALSEEDRAIMAETGPRGVFGEFFDQLRGTQAWIKWMTTLMIFIFVGLAFWSGWNLFVATDALGAVKWGVVASVSFLVISMLKIYLFNEMQSDRMMRELKRLELMIAARDK